MNYATNIRVNDRLHEKWCGAAKAWLTNNEFRVTKIKCETQRIHRKRKKRRRPKSNQTKTIQVLNVVNKISMGFVRERRRQCERNTKFLSLNFLKKIFDKNLKCTQVPFIQMWFGKERSAKQRNYHSCFRYSPSVWKYVRKILKENYWRQARKRNAITCKVHRIERRKKKNGTVNYNVHQQVL